MTLKEWCEMYHKHATHPTSECGAVSVVIRTLEPLGDPEMMPALMSLTDFVVDGRYPSRTAPTQVIWLLPRKPPKEEPAALEITTVERQFLGDLCKATEKYVTAEVPAINANYNLASRVEAAVANAQQTPTTLAALYHRLWLEKEKQ